MGAGVLVAAAMDGLGIPARWYTTWVAFLPLAGFAYLTTRRTDRRG